MQESVIYQDIKAEGLQEGETKLVLRQLNRRIGTVPGELVAQIKGMKLEQVEALGEALLDFIAQEDLVQWLEQHTE